MKFSVTSLDSNGAKKVAVLEAASRSALYAEIRGRGETFVSATESGKKSGMTLNSNFFHRGVKLDEKVLIARNLSAMLTAGLALSKALSVLERQAGSARLKDAIRGVIDEISKGSPLSTALGRFPDVFPTLFISMAHAGEESGKLSEALALVASQMEKTSQLMKKIKGAMIYPAIIISLMFAIGVLMMIFVVPTLASTFRELNVKLPAMTRVLIGISDFLTNHTLLFLAILVGIVLSVYFFLKSAPGKRALDFAAIRFPITGKIGIETNAAHTARTLSSLLSSGVDVVQSLSITRDVIGNSYYKEVLASAVERIEKGVPLSAIFFENERIYPPLVGEMVNVGEETGELPQMLARLAEFYEGEVDQKTKDLSTVIEPFLMVIIGAGVGFFALAMISPTYSLVNVIN